MLVYGERTRTVDPRALLRELRARVDELASASRLSQVPHPEEPAPAGLEGRPRVPTSFEARLRRAPQDEDGGGHGPSNRSEPTVAVHRHAALVGALIEAGELAQGLADAAFEASGADGPESAADAAMALTLALARAVVASWRGLGRGTAPDLAPARAALEALAALPLPAAVTTKVGEGYAFYALYPETYAEAVAGLDLAPTTVVGLRSIGTSLAAVVAAALGAPPPITLRPVGHPFRRTLNLAPETAALLGEGGADPHRRYSVVDEGPGLSGSSFGAVLDRLEANGVPRAKVTVFPSHGGDLGPQADAAHRARWAALDRRAVGFDELILNAADPAHRLESWVPDLTGSATEPLQDLSGGGWRALRYACEADWPPAHTGQERRKYLLRSDRGAFLLKFAGLGRTGERKLAHARALAAAGFTPMPLSLRHGFMVERWIEPSTERATGSVPLGRVAAYLAFRARALPAGPDDGASVRALFDMALANAAEGLGSRAAAAAVERLRPALPGLAAQARPVFTDGRMQPWEWMVDAGGAWLKTDAVDHADAHDLIGAQDIAWDVAGATVEFDLGPGLAVRLGEEVGRRAGELISREGLSFFILAYCAFQLGAWTMAAEAHGHWPAERVRLAAARDRYARRLELELGR